jgi:Fic family protein
VDVKRFQSAEFGEPYRDRATGWDFWAFRPVPIPREFALTAETVLALSTADMALGRLAGAGRQVHDPDIFLRPYLTREAVASSRIEGTQASLSDVFQADASDEEATNPDVREVQNYRRAMEVGLAELAARPLVGSVVCEIHRVLMQAVRGEQRRPGEFRETPVWIGSPTDAAETAVFVPPLPREMLLAWRDWEEFANSEPRLPKLVQCAFLHYQFETIHPFGDGNGRLGRLLIVFYLVHRAALPAPLLYISSYFERNRRDYYDRLQAVRERGEMQEWLQFFLTAVAAQADDGIVRAELMHDLRERYRADLAGSRSRAVEVVDLLFENPILSARRVADRLGVTVQGAHRLVRQLEERGWLDAIGSLGRGGRAYWVATEILDAISDPRESEAPPVPRQLTVSPPTGDA